jgi:Xaa-Pro aminopeptidase
MKERIEQIRAALAVNEAALIESGANRFYLTGFPSSAGILLITAQDAYFIIDFRYVEKARATVKTANVILMENSREQIARLLAQDGATRLYVEAGSTSIARFATLREWLPGVTLCEEDTIDRALVEARAIKTREELSNIVAAQQMTDETFTYILDRITPGRTEREVMLDMEFYMRRLGSEGVSFDFIVVSGKNSSLPHGVPTDKPIERGDFVTMDFGAVVNGYHSDMTRTVAVGTVSEEQKRVYDTVYAAQKASLDFIRPGVSCFDVDRVARELIYGAGYEGCFGHGLGHSVGVEIHENPSCNTRCQEILRPGIVMTVEPGIYLENKFGVRIEDMVYLTETGSENLTKSEKKLLIV